MKPLLAKWRVIVVVIGLSIFGCATQKFEQVPGYIQEKCDAPIWNEGDSWKFIGGGGQIWEENIIGSALRQTPQKGFYGIFNIPFVGVKIFPLWVGKKVGGAEYVKTVEGIDFVVHYSFRVVELAEMKVEAGTFKSYKIEFKIIAPDGEDGLGYFYYSPKTKSIVKFETRSFILYPWGNYELQSFNVR